MSLRSWQWHEYHRNPQGILENWVLELVCLEGWSENTAQKYVKLLQAGNAPAVVKEKFLTYLHKRGYNEEDLECLFPPITL